ncbi:hypothetical protein GFL95_14275 [Rhizobium leguminosarum bv. viciae]|uniref:hypothetical protein n=1 Tax=Rhizobium leguminosarum TaxID=384 RepID=UPI00144122E1|nr:hypothetical protein [Rhizobium leguminosarum]NKK92382.1 hypothetical protein [Rhizobium leguminosarum bv. viciae]
MADERNQASMRANMQKVLASTGKANAEADTATSHPQSEHAEPSTAPPTGLAANMRKLIGSERR